MLDLPIIDAHVHFWDPDLLPYPWLEQVPPLNRTWLPADFREARGELPVAGLVFVEAGVSAVDAIAEAAWVGELAANDPLIRGIVAGAPLEMGEGVRRWLDQLVELPLVKGVRRNLQGHDEEWCLQPDFIEGVECLAAYGYTCDLCVGPPQMAAIIDLVCECPEVTFVLDHLGKPDIRGGEIEPWEPQMEELAGFPNCVVKLSGLVTEADLKTWQEADLRPYCRHALTCFGPERVMFGGDWPVVTLASTYRRWAETAAQAVQEVAAADCRQVFHDTAVRVYRLEG